NPSDVVRLEVEVEPLGTAFTGVPNGSGAAVANGTIATATVAGLTDNVSYHWQARAVDQTGRAGPWASFGGNAETAADFKVAMAGSQLVFTVPPTNTAAGAPITPAVQVTARDASGNTATQFTGNITVALGANQGGATLGGVPTHAAVAGVASFPGLSLNKTGSGYTLTATTGGIPGVATSAQFNVVAAAAGQLALTTPPSATAQSGAPFAQQPAVQVQDANGNPVATQGVGVTASIATGPAGASLASFSATSDATGLARFAALTLSGPPGSYTLMFASGTLSTVTSGAIALSAGAATQIALNAGNNQTVAAGSAVPIRPSVIVRDGSGNPVAGVAVTFAVAPGNGTITGPNQITDATGIAAVASWTLATTAGANTLTATATGLTGSPVTFTATGTAGSAGSIAAFAGDRQTATVNTAVTPPAVIVQDQFGNPVAGVAVTFAPAAGSGTVNPTTPVTTGPGGIAAVSSWTLGTTAGPNTLTATAAGSGITGNPVTFTATGTAGAAAKLAITTQPSATARSGVAFLQQPVIQLQDASGNPVSQSGTPVTATIASGGGTL